MSMLTVLSIDHRHGTHTSLHRDRDGAMRELGEWVAQWWEMEMEEPMWQDGETPGADDTVYATGDGAQPVTADVIDTYFTEARDEFYTISEAATPEGVTVTNPGDDTASAQATT